MPTPTDMTLDCYATTPTPDTEDFRVEATVTAEGELPTTAIFVYSIGDTEDSSTDSFARIANPQDLQNLSVSRALAVTNSVDEYLASYAAFQYQNLDVAVGAKAMLKGRVNDLVKRWIVYSSVFLQDSGLSQSYPSSDPSVQEALESDYADAKEARVAAEVAVTDADTALTSAKDDVDVVQELINRAESCTGFMQVFSEKFYDYVDAVHSGGSEGASAAAIRTASLYPMLTSRGAECNSELQTQINNKNTADTAVATATADKIEAETELTAAQAAEDAALAAVLNVCPDFDPASV